MKYLSDELEPPEPSGLKIFLTKIKPEKEKTTGEHLNVTKEHNIPKIQQFSNCLQPVISFLESLTYSYDDGRILFKGDTEKGACKFLFLLLNPSSQFNEIIKQARSVIVAGGTMKPVSEFRNRLFVNAGAKPERILEFACDHIIAPENILPIIITKGPRNEKLLFNFENRMNMVYRYACIF